MSLISHLLHGLFTLLLLLLLRSDLLLALPALPDSDTASIQPFHPTQPTIPAFPEQSDLSGCPLDLPNELFNGIRSACASNPRTGHLSRSTCCPALAAWLYSAYSATALGRASRLPAAPYDLPLLPDDSETCVENLEKALNGKGVELKRPNETCDVVYCYCGVRLHPLSCPESFSVSNQGRLVGHESVKMLEKDCLGNSKNNKGHSSLAACSKCLKRLYQLNEERGSNASASDRKSKMHSRDCQLMGLTWLLSRNRTAYIPTVTSVIRSLMMGTDGSDLPQSCSLASDGMPLAVDSTELDGQSSSSTSPPPVPLILLFLTTLWFGFS